MSTFEQEELWREAKAFAGSASFREVMRIMEEKYTADWKLSEPGDSQKRDDAYHMVRATTALRDELTAIAATPDVVQFNRRLKRN